MKSKILSMSFLVASINCVFATTNHDHHNQNQLHTAKCDFSLIEKHAKNPSQKISSLMHAPMICNPWVESKNIEKDFLSNMIPHHQGAILSSEALLEYTKSPELKQIAQKIIQIQTNEIEYFHQVLEKLESFESKEYKSFAKEAKEDMRKMMKNMHLENYSKDVELDYMKAMIAHHQGAIEAAKQVLKYTKNQEVIQIANKIIASQEEDIKKFDHLIKQKQG